MINRLQRAIKTWAVACHGRAIADDKMERAYRFLEESLELAQACGLSRDEAIRLLDYTYSRPIGQVDQEIGGTSITLNLLCSAYDVSLEHLTNKELQRCWDNIDKIRQKNKTKTLHPEHYFAGINLERDPI